MTRVKFVKFCNEILALFPDEIWSQDGSIMSYARIGQHGGASRSLMRCKAATPDEYMGLLNELKSVGYDDLVVINGGRK